MGKLGVRVEVTAERKKLVLQCGQRVDRHQQTITEPSPSRPSESVIGDVGAPDLSQSVSHLAAGGTDNILLPMKEALAARATGGEVAHALRDVWGTYVPHDAF